MRSPLQRLTDTCWSFGAGPSLCQPSAPIKEVAVEGGERDVTAANWDDPTPALERREAPPWTGVVAVPSERVRWPSVIHAVSQWSCVLQITLRSCWTCCFSILLIRGDLTGENAVFLSHQLILTFWADGLHNMWNESAENVQNTQRVF